MLSVYYLPRLSSLVSRAEIRREILSGYKITLPILVILFTSVYLARDLIILVLYTEKFSPVNQLFAPMLIGDFLKMVSWLVALLMLAKAKLRMFVTTQICFSLLTYFLSIAMIDQMGLIGAIYAHAIKYAIYTLVVFWLLRDYVFTAS